MKRKLKTILLMMTFLMILLTASPVKALECSQGTCYCNESLDKCIIWSDPRGVYTTPADKSKCGCPPDDTTNDDYQEKEWTLIESDTFCTRSSSVWQLVGYVLYAAKIIIPVIIMILGVVDFVKAIFLSDEKSVQKAGITLLQRAIMGVAIFFVPTLVSLVIGLVSDMAEASEKIAGCETCLLRPTSQDCKDIKDEAKALREQNNG